MRGRPMFHRTILFALKPGIALDRVRVARESLQRLIEWNGLEHQRYQAARHGEHRIGASGQKQPFAA